MVKNNCLRRSCKDVFNAKLLSHASYAGILEIPVIEPTYWVPNRLISFSKAIGTKDYDQWVHFYEDDYLIERVWRNPERYLGILKKFNGVILPDFSLYRDMPLVMQIWNIFRSRAIGYWLQTNGVKIIVNIRYGDKRTYLYSCKGVSKNCSIAIGALGNIKDVDNRRIFIDGLSFVIDYLKPSALVVYGSMPREIIDKYINLGIKVVSFSSETSIAHQEVV